MYSFITKNKNKIIIISIWILLGIIFYSYGLTFTWDSSEYLGLADVLGTKQMTNNWIGRRGFSFPLILKFGSLIGLKNLMFIFYTITYMALCKFYFKFKEMKLLNSKISLFFILYCLFFLMLHSILFAYFHTALTEFVAITFLSITIYLSWNFIKCFWETEPTKFYLYTIVFSLIVTFMYQVKQSLTPMMIIPILLANAFSILSSFNKKNLISRILSVIFIICILILNIFIWKSFMKQSPSEGLYLQSFNNSIKYAQDILNKKDTNIFSAYWDRYKDLLIITDEFPFWVFKENYSIGHRIYRVSASNIVDFNPYYVSYIKPYRTIISENFISRMFNTYLRYTYIFMMCFTKITLLAAPILLLLLCFLYLFFMKKLKSRILSLFQLTIILYATTFLGIFTYVFFNAIYDRYAVPLMFTGIFGNLCLILLILNIVKNKSAFKKQNTVD